MPYPLELAPLAPEERAALLERFNTTSDPETRTRYQMVLLATERDKHSPEIASVVFRSHDTVWRVLRRFEEGGLAAIPRRHGGGTKPILTPEAEAELRRVIEEDPHLFGINSANWTTATLASYLAQKMGIAVCDETIRLALHRLGYVCKRPTWTVQHKAQEREDWEGKGCG